MFENELNIYFCPKNKNMRKILLIKILNILCIVLFASCSNNENDKDTIPNEKSILIKKITETIYYSNDSDINIFDFSYEKDVLKTVTTGRYKSEFIYDGNKVSKVNYFKDGIPSGSTIFYYNGDFLIYTLSGENHEEKTEYSYVDGILASQKSGYFSGTNYNVQEELSYSFDQAKNIIQIKSKSSLFGSETISKSNYYYDNKNHPMKFMNRYYRLVFQLEGFDGIAANNVISREYYYPVTSETPSYSNFEIIYNNDNFPIEIQKINKASNQLISKTVIEYQ